MATPVGHVLAGYLVYRSIRGPDRRGSRLFLLLCIFMAVSPDLDFLPGIFIGQPALYHRGVSHSLSLAAACGLLAALAYRIYVPGNAMVLKDWSVFFLAYVSHLFIDLFGPDRRPPYGIPLFWPLSDDTYIAPVQIFWGVHHAQTTSASTEQWLTGILDIYNLASVGIEVLVFAPVILLVMYMQRSRFVSSDHKPGLHRGV